MIPIYPVNYPEGVDQNADHTVIFAPVEGDLQPKLKRTGYCSRCGNCCDDSENIFKDVDGNGNTPGLEQVVPGKCAYFRWIDGLAGCVGRDTAYYKNGCNFAPTHPSMVNDWPDCTYKFETIADGN
jgi:hypothetical protein